MEFIKNNFLNTSTQLVITNNTSTVENIINPDKIIQYFTDGDNSDLTTTSLTINFDETQTVSRIGLVGINWQKFTVFYNGATASTFSLTSTGATTASDFANNSETSMYMQATPVLCTSVTFDFSETIIANSEKVLGHLQISDTHVVFPRLPSAKNYKPLFSPKQTVHKMSDGGTRIHYITQKKTAQIKFSYVEESFRDSLKTVYDLDDSFVFVAFPTMASWDLIMFEAVWPGAFDFFKYSDNAAAAGFSGKIKLQETSI